MDKSHLLMKIEQKKSDLDKYIFDSALELSFFSVIAIIYFLIKNGFDIIYFLIFIPLILILLIIGFIIKYVPMKNYININTKENKIIFRKKNKIKEYKIDELLIESKIINTNNFTYILYFKYNNKIVFSINNNSFKSPNQNSKDFYLLLNKYLNINELQKNWLRI